MMHRALAAIVFVGVMAGGGEAAPPAGAAASGCRPGTLPRLVRERAEIDGRAYFIDAPEHPGNQPLAVVFVFHGFGSDAADVRDGVGFAELAQSERFIAVHPEGHDGVHLLGRVGRGWDMTLDQRTDAVFVGKILDRLAADRCVDMRRVYATGFSNGGFVSSLLGCQMADRLAAVAPVGGALRLDDCKPARPIPVLVHHGKNDPVVDPAKVRDAVSWWRTTNACASETTDQAGCQRGLKCKADVLFCEGDQLHTWPAEATRRIWTFFQARPHPAPSQAR